MSAEDAYRGEATKISDPIADGADVSPNDGADLSFVTRGLMVTAGGDVAVAFPNGKTMTLPGLVPGHIYPFRVARVYATNTTATGIKALY